MIQGNPGQCPAKAAGARAVPAPEISAREIVGMECYKALRKIRAILADDRLNDAECFQKIAEIVQVFEQMHTGCGGRHDFG